MFVPQRTKRLFVLEEGFLHYYKVDNEQGQRKLRSFHTITSAWSFRRSGEVSIDIDDKPRSRLMTLICSSFAEREDWLRDLRRAREAHDKYRIQDHPAYLWYNVGVEERTIIAIDEGEKKKLFGFIKKDNVDEVSKFLNFAHPQHEKYLTAKDTKNRSPLAYAIEMNAKKCVDVLLKKGGALFDHQLMSWTPQGRVIFDAAISDYEQFIKKKFSFADDGDEKAMVELKNIFEKKNYSVPEWRSSTGETFLHLLAQICAVRTTEYLLNRIRKDASLNFEAYVNATDASGRTALHHAIIGKNIKEAQHFLKLLFDNKGNPNCIDSVGMSALVGDSCILHRHHLDILTYSCSLAPLLISIWLPLRITKRLWRSY